jgi:glycerate kinase
VELAQASGLHLLPAEGPSPRTAPIAGTYGTGELLLAALDGGADTIVLGLGGSATTDGGAGMLQALGARFRDEAGQLLGPGLARPGTVASADLAGLDPRVLDADVVMAMDVDNPLFGPRGAAAVFGPQKGATAEQVLELDEDLRHWSRVLAEAGATSDPELAGSGAAGGVGYAALGVLKARARPGVDVILDLVGFDRLLSAASLVVTGEGSLDEQSLGGKAPIGVLRRAQAVGVPTIAVAGRSALDAETLTRTGFAAVLTLQEREPDLGRCILEADRLLREVGRVVAVADV